jgi:hypothetical protein
MFRSRPAVFAAAILVLDIALFALSGVPRFKNATHGTNYVLGEIFWLGFLVGTLALLVTVAVWVTTTSRRRRAAN